MRTERFRAFAIITALVSSIAYPIVLFEGWPLFTFYPPLGEWTLFKRPPLSGPTPADSLVLDWFGITATSLLAGLLAGLVASVLLPPTWAKRLWPGLAWVIPLIALLVVFYLDASGF
jgi:hypothetical protein